MSSISLYEEETFSAIQLTVNSISKLREETFLT